MKFATERDGTPDGRLVIVARDLGQCVSAAPIASTLQEALDRWEAVEPELLALSNQLNSGCAAGAVPFRAEAMMAPLPRAWQWLDGSAYATHGALMQKAYNHPPIESEAPLMYQGMSHRFLAWNEDVVLPSEADGIDFEAEFGIVTGTVRMGTPAAGAESSILLAVLLNDWSLRAIAPVEMKTGFGWIQAKPACSMAPVAMTLDELGSAWADGRIVGRMRVERGGDLFGDVPSADMAFSFPELVAHAARTRDLCAGTIIGSGTVSSPSYAEVGSCCISERRAIEMIDTGAPQTPFLGFGERVRMEAAFPQSETAFGEIDQKIVACP